MLILQELKLLAYWRTSVLSIYQANHEILVNNGVDIVESIVSHWWHSFSLRCANRWLYSTSLICQTPYLYSTSEEMSECLYHMRSDKIRCQQQIRRLWEVIDKSILTNGVTLDEQLHGNFLQLTSNYSEVVHSSHEEFKGIFEWLFWDQQQTGNSLKNSKSMCWHPLVIKWCLYTWDTCLARHMSFYTVPDA